MNQYITGTIIRELRKKNLMHRLQPAEKPGATDKKDERRFGLIKVHKI